MNKKVLAVVLAAGGIGIYLYVKNKINVSAAPSYAPDMPPDYVPPANTQTLPPPPPIYISPEQTRPAITTPSEIVAAAAVGIRPTEAELYKIYAPKTNGINGFFL